MPEYRVTVSLAVRDYPNDYGASYESSNHQFFIEAESAAVAASMAREQFLVMRDFLTADTHDRDVAAELETKREAEAIARAQS